MIRDYAETCLLAKSVEATVTSDDPVFNAIAGMPEECLESIAEHADLIERKLPLCPSDYPIDQFIARVLIFRHGSIR